MKQVLTATNKQFMIFRFVLLFALCHFAIPFFCCAQSIHYKDGSALNTAYCREDTDFAIVGQPAGGTFSGCGIFQQNGDWYFNPLEASATATAFPFQCTITYTVNNMTAELPVIVWKPVSLLLTADTATCDGNFSLDAKTGYAGDYSYSWTPAAVLAQSNAAATSGNIQHNQRFTCTVTDLSTGCTGSDTISVIKHELPQLLVSNDTLIVQHASLQLFASGADTYEWMPDRWLDHNDRPDPVSAPEDSVTYTVKGTNAYGCTATAQVHIDLARGVYFPTAFSPNGDGLNDEFRIVNFGYQTLREFRIFNRWGQQVFFTMNGTKGWDGTYNNQPADMGTYHYLIRMKMDTGVEQTIKGDLTLVR